MTAVQVVSLSVLMALPMHSVEQRPYEDLVCSYDWDCGSAMRVMFCESSGNPRAYAAGNYGLWQLNRVHAWRVGGDPELFFDPETATATAYQIWSEQGWRPWACKP